MERDTLANPDRSYSKETIDMHETFKQTVLLRIPVLNDLRKGLIESISPHMKPTHVSYIDKKIGELLSYSNYYLTEDHYNYIALSTIYDFFQTLITEQITKNNTVNGEMNRETGSSLVEIRCYFKKDVYVFTDKVREITTFADNCKNFPLDDLYCQAPTSQDWKILKSITKYYQFSPKQISIQNYQSYAGKVFFLVAAMGRGSNLIPKEEGEVDDLLDKLLFEPEAVGPVTVGGAPYKEDKKLDDLTPALFGRFLKYSIKPDKGLIDGGFFMGNPDNRILKVLFNFVELPIVRFVRKTFTFEKVKIDTKHYIDPSIFKDLFEDEPGDRPPNLRNGLSSFRFIQQKLVENNEGKVKSNLIRVRFLYYNRLRSLQSKIDSLVRNRKTNTKQNQIGLVQSQTKYGELEEEAVKPSKDPELDRLQKEWENNDEEIDFDECYNQEKPVLSANAYKNLNLNNGGIDVGFENLSPDRFNSSATILMSPQRTPLKNSIRNPLKSPRKTHAPLFSPLKEKEDLQFDCDVDESSTYKILPPADMKRFETVVIHCHGGGFVGQTSSSHQAYMNKWVNDFKVPFFSIDYRLAPESQFPVLVNDVIKGYLWVLGYMQYVLGVRPKHILCIGDSAGSNLLCGLTSWCILNNVRRPDHLVLFYPAMGLDEQIFTPSLLFSLDDLMLNYSALRMCSGYYVGRHQRPDDNFFLSCALTPKEVLRKFPQVELFVSDRDPLRDDGMRFALRAVKSGCNIKLHYLENLSHALLSQSTGGGLVEAKQFMIEAVRIIKKILSRFEEEKL